MTKHDPKLITFAEGGDRVYYTNGCTGSGYGNPDRPHASADMPEGIPCIDKRAALKTEAGLKLLLRGPMVSADLPDGEVEVCPEPSPILAAGVAGNAFGNLLALNAAHKLVAPKTPGPLDSVSVSAYVELWRAAGARIGVTGPNNTFIWE
jgi:hypothetical protein